MPRYRKHRHQLPENHRRKCVDTGTVKQVKHRYIKIPAEFTSPKKTEGFTYEDIPGVEIYNYSSTEGALESDKDFVNHYDEEQFIR